MIFIKMGRLKEGKQFRELGPDKSQCRLFSSSLDFFYHFESVVTNYYLNSEIFYPQKLETTKGKKGPNYSCSLNAALGSIPPAFILKWLSMI